MIGVIIFFGGMVHIQPHLQHAANLNDFIHFPKNAQQNDRHNSSFCGLTLSLSPVWPFSGDVSYKTKYTYLFAQFDYFREMLWVLCFIYSIVLLIRWLM